jgi:energy-coupling factor transporter ATP-binding protein EcfA2
MLAAMLSRCPPLLVLDEPLSMLDTNAAQDLVTHLGELAHQGSAIVVCEHRSHYFHDAGAFHEYPLPSPHQSFEQDDAPAPISSAPDFHFSVQNLSVNFGQRRILENISLDLNSGQIAALVGVNGSGKTTLLRSLIDLQRHEGKVQVSDGDKPDLGLVYQNPDLQLFNPTVREEILFRVKQPNESLYQWLITRLGLSRYENHSPLLLSEGEKKRLCLAMVLMHQPRHGVLLDEPTLGQDDHHRILLGRTLQGLAQAGRLVIVATHDLAWAAHYATQMLVLHEGEIIANGNPRTLLRDAPIWKRVNLRVPNWIWEPIDRDPKGLSIRLNLNQPGKPLGSDGEA